MISHLSQDLAAISSRLADRGKEVVTGYTSGVFDLFHQGHLNYLTACKRAVDILIVGVDADSLVRLRKGSHRPYETCSKRVFNVKETGLVDELFVKEVSFEKIIPVVRPHIYFIPSNRNVDDLRLNLLNEFSVQINVLPYTVGVSTTEIARIIGVSPYTY